MQGKLQGEGKKIRGWRTGDTEYTETKFYHVEREGEVDLKNLAENALQKANVQLVKGVLPYQFNERKILIWDIFPVSWQRNVTSSRKQWKEICRLR